MRRGWRQIIRRGAAEHLLDRTLSLVDGVFSLVRPTHGLHTQAEQIRQEVLDLVRGVGAQHVDRQATLLGVRDRALALTVVGLERDDRLRIVDRVDQLCRDAQVSHGLVEPVARDAIGVDAHGLERGARIGDRLGGQPALHRGRRCGGRIAGADRRKAAGSHGACRAVATVLPGPGVAAQRLRIRRLLDLHLAVDHAAQFGRARPAAQERVDRHGHVMVHGELFARLDLDQHVEGRGRPPLEHGLLSAAAARLFVGERHRLDPADQVGQGRVEHQVLERIAVRGADELHAAFGDRAGGHRLELAPDLVDHDDLGVVVLDRLDHHLMLQRRLSDLHAARAADGRVRHVAVAADLVRGVDDDHALLLGQRARGFAQHRRLADARAA